jgi:O-antigen ligase
VYLGCGDNKYVEGARRAPTMLISPDIELPATDATVLDRRAAQLRLEYVARQKVTRPADWLMREADAAMGIAHYWLREPIVEQGSMNGRFVSVLDDKRTDRGRRWNWLRFRWDRWRRRTLGSTRPAEAQRDVGAARATVRFDTWAVTIARLAAALTAVGAFVVTGLASGAAGIMVLALLAAPSRWQRLKHAFWQPLGRAALLMIAVLAIAMLWSPLPTKAALREWVAWRQFAWLFCALALFETARAKRMFTILFTIAASVTACAGVVAFLGDIRIHDHPIAPYVVFRNHVTQSMAFAAGALFAALLSLDASLPRWARRLAALAVIVLVAGVVTTPGRSGYLVLAVAALAVVQGIGHLRTRAAATAGVAVVLAAAALTSPLVIERFQRGIEELRHAGEATELTSMGVRVVIWRNTLEVARKAPLLGHGLGSFQAAYAGVAQRHAGGWRATPSDDPHNQYLSFLAETGVVGLAVFLWFLLAAVRQPVRGRYRAAGLALLAAWTLTSLFSSHFQTFNEGHMIMLFLGALLCGEALIQPPSAASTAATTSS